MGGRGHEIQSGLAEPAKPSSSKRLEGFVASPLCADDVVQFQENVLFSTDRGGFAYQAVVLKRELHVSPGSN